MGVWETIFDHLKTEGFDVYSPATHEGDCIKPYIVVMRSGSSKHTSFSTNIDYYDLLLYVPKKEYSKVDGMVANVKKVMTKLEPQVWPAGIEQPTVYDDSLGGHMTSVMYKNYKLMPTKLRMEG